MPDPPSPHNDCWDSTSSGRSGEAQSPDTMSQHPTSQVDNQPTDTSGSVMECESTEAESAELPHCYPCREHHTPDYYRAHV